jgi:hypothetical protein
MLHATVSRLRTHGSREAAGPRGPANEVCGQGAATNAVAHHCGQRARGREQRALAFVRPLRHGPAASASPGRAGLRPPPLRSRLPPDPGAGGRGGTGGVGCRPPESLPDERPVSSSSGSSQLSRFRKVPVPDRDGSTPDCRRLRPGRRKRTDGGPRRQAAEAGRTLAAMAPHGRSTGARAHPEESFPFLSCGAGTRRGDGRRIGQSSRQLGAGPHPAGADSERAARGLCGSGFGAGLRITRRRTVVPTAPPAGGRGDRPRRPTEIAGSRRRADHRPECPASASLVSGVAECCGIVLPLSGSGSMVPAR